MHSFIVTMIAGLTLATSAVSDVVVKSDSFSGDTKFSHEDAIGMRADGYSGDFEVNFLIIHNDAENDTDFVVIAHMTDKVGMFPRTAYIGSTDNVVDVHRLNRNPMCHGRGPCTVFQTVAFYVDEAFAKGMASGGERKKIRMNTSKGYFDFEIGPRMVAGVYNKFRGMFPDR